MVLNSNQKEICSGALDDMVETYLTEILNIGKNKHMGKKWKAILTMNVLEYMAKEVHAQSGLRNSFYPLSLLWAAQAKLLLLQSPP